MCVRRNVQLRELKLYKSTRFALITAVMVAVPTGGSTGCLVSPPPLFSQNIQSHEKSPTSHRAHCVPPTVSLALGANRKGQERVKGKASRIQRSRTGSALVCVRRNAQHRELNSRVHANFAQYCSNGGCVHLWAHRRKSSSPFVPKHTITQKIIHKL